MKFDSAVIQAGWRAQTPGVNHRNDVAPEPDDVVVFSGSNDDGEIHIPAEGVAIAHETATVKPFFSVFRIEWKATGPFTGTFSAATGRLDLSGTLEQTIREGSNVCTTGPINIKLSTEGSPYGNSNEGVRFVDGLEGAGTLTGSGELPLLISQTRGDACDKEALSCYARSSITGRSLTAAFATSGPLKRAAASLEICDPPTVVDPPKTPTTAGERAQVVFDSGQRVISIDADGENRENLTPHRKLRTGWLEEPSSMPSISPDGERLAYLEHYYVKGWPSARVVVASRDGSVREVVLDSRKFTLPASIGDLGWTPGGRLFVVEFLLGGKKLGYNLTRVVTFNPDGSKRRIEHKRIYRGVRDRFIVEATFSPDGKRILLTTVSGGAIPRLELLDRSTGKTRVVRNRAESADYSPDGKRIVFVSDRTGIRDSCTRSRCFGDPKVFVARTDGSRARRLTKGHAPGHETDPAWSPDGSSIAFASDRNSPWLSEGAGREIYTVKPDGSCLAWLTNGTPGSSSPSWGPEADADTASAACGRSEREPLIELVPAKRSVVNGEVTKWPQLWLGPVFEGKGQSYPPDDGRELAYEDCVRWDRSDCGRRSFGVASDDVCLRWVEQLSSYGELGRVIWRRGALAFLPSAKKKAGDAVVLTGGQAVMFSVDGPKALPRARYLKAIDALKPVGGDAAADLEPPVVGDRMPARARKVARALEAAGSVDRAAKKLGMSPATVRVWADLDRILESHGPVKTVSCKGWF